MGEQRLRGTAVTPAWLPRQGYGSRHPEKKTLARKPHWGQPSPCWGGSPCQAPWGCVAEGIPGGAAQLGAGRVPGSRGPVCLGGSPCLGQAGPRGCVLRDVPSLVPGSSGGLGLPQGSPVAPAVCCGSGKGCGAGRAGGCGDGDAGGEKWEPACASGSQHFPSDTAGCGTPCGHDVPTSPQR